MPNLLYGAMGQSYKVPQNNSETITFSRFEKFATMTGVAAGSVRALTEGVTPAEGSPTRSTVSLTLGQYGYLTKWTDKVDWINEWQVDRPLMERNAEDMKETADRVYRDGILGGTTVYRVTDGVGGVSGAARVNVAGRVNATMFDLASSKLKRNGAKFYKDMIKAGTKVSTQGVRDSFAAIFHTDAETDLKNINQFLTTEKYAGGDLMPGEYGAYGSVRVATTQIARVYPDTGASSTGGKSTTGTSADVYIGHIFGKQAYGVVDLASASDVYYIPPSQIDKTDPLGQVATLGYKIYCGSLILNENWIIRVEHIVSNFA